MIVNKPSIFIYVNNPNNDYLKQICAGVEEEGVFYEVFEKDTEALDNLAYDAANDSMMGSGIGIFQNTIALQMKGIPKGRNVQNFAAPTLEDCRKIGANSARIIKKMALK